MGCLCFALSQVPDLVPMVLVEFDYLVTKDKIEDGENFKDFLNPVVSFLIMVGTAHAITIVGSGGHAS